MEELTLYTAVADEELENLLAAGRMDKVNLLERYNNPWRIIGYYAFKDCVATVWIYDEGLNQAVEYEVPADMLKENFDHALAHPDAIFDLDVRGYDDGA